MKHTILQLSIFISILISFISCRNETDRIQKFNSFDTYKLSPQIIKNSTCKKFDVLCTFNKEMISSFSFINTSNNKVILKDSVIHFKNKICLVHNQITNNDSNIICTLLINGNPIEFKFVKEQDSIALISVLGIYKNKLLYLNNKLINIYGKRFSRIEEFIQLKNFDLLFGNLNEYGVGGGGIEIDYKDCLYISKNYRLFGEEMSKSYSSSDSSSLSFGNCLYLDRNSN